MKILSNFPMFGAFLESLFTVMYNRQKRATMRFAAKFLPKILTLIAILGALMVVGGCVVVGGGSLYASVYRGDISKIRRHLDRGGDINAENEQGETLLHMAAKYGQMEIVQFLINRGADVNAGTGVGEFSWVPVGKTPLMMVSVEGHVKIAKLLIERGADVNAKTNRGDTALMYAVTLKHIEIAKLLIERGADVNAHNNHGSTALMDVGRYAGVHLSGKPPLVGYSVDRKGYHAYALEKEIVNLLLDGGADINARSDDENTALLGAIERGHIEIANLLIERGADIYAENNKGWTALLFLLWQGEKNDIENAKFLLSKGCRLPEISPNFAELLVTHLPVRILELNGSEYEKGGSGRIGLSPGLNSVKVDYYYFFSSEHSVTGKPITLKFNAKAGHLYVIEHEVLKSQKLFRGDKWQAWFLELKP